MYNNTYYEFECPTCGLQSEFSFDEFDPENPIIECPMCNTLWLVEETAGESWLEPIQEFKQ